MRVPALIATLAAAWAIAGLAAQVRPDFSGQWTADPLPPAKPGESRAHSRWGRVVTITQDTNALTVHYVSNSRAHAPVTYEYAFDGSERRITDRNSVEPQIRLTRAEWRGAQLVLTTIFPGRKDANGRFSATPTETTERLSLESPTTMTVEISIKSEFGSPTGRVVYRR
jgi:hypothetical protein